MYIKLTDWVYNPIKDNISLLFFAPHLLAYVQLEIDRHEDITKKIIELKDKIARGDI